MFSEPGTVYICECNFYGSGGLNLMKPLEVIKHYVEAKGIKDCNLSGLQMELMNSAKNNLEER